MISIISSLLSRPNGRAGLWSHASFLKLWCGQAISELGSQVSLLAVPLAAVGMHASAFEVAVLIVGQFLPFVVLSLPAGLIIDRLPRRPILAASDIGRALLLATIPIAYELGVLTIWQLYAVAVLGGIFTVFFDVAYQSYLPSLVSSSELIDANSKLAATASVAQVAGPSLGGLLIGAIAAPRAIAIDGASFVASGLLVLSIGQRELVQRLRPEQTGSSIRQELLDGLRWVFGNRCLRAQALSTGMSNFCAFAVWSILIVFAVRDLGLRAQTIGLILAAGNAGVFLGIIAAGRLLRRFGIGPTTLGASIVSAPALLAVAFAPRQHPVPFLITAQVLSSIGGVVYNIVQISFRQQITPARLQGRMNSVMRLLVWGTIPLGGLAGGGLAATVGLRKAILIAAVANVFTFVPILLSPIPSLRAAVAEPQRDMQAVDFGAH